MDIVVVLFAIDHGGIGLKHFKSGRLTRGGQKSSDDYAYLGVA